MADRTMKKGDTWPPLWVTLRYTNDLGSVVPYDLTVASRVSLVMKCTPTIFAATMVIASALGGRCNYPWVAGDTDGVGDWQTEFEILWSSGKEETAPNSGTRTLTIEEDLRP